MPRTRIEGVSEMLRMFDEAPKEMISDVKAALRSACGTEKRILKSGVPRKARPLVKSKVKGQRSGDISAMFGLFIDKDWTDLNGRKGPEWFRMYWKNYGTLSGRDPSHDFDNPIKGDGTQAARNRRNRTGQPHENFFENAISGWESRFLDNFARALREKGYDI